MRRSMADIAPALGRVTCASVIVASGALLLGQQPEARQERPVFSAGTEIVQVDVSVLDRRRQPIQGLTAGNFTILEDGQPRPIVSFTAVELPPADAPPVVPPDTDVASNAIGNQEGRLVVIMLDRTIEAGWPWSSAKRVAVETVEQLGPNDLAAVVTSNGATQNLTTDRDLLLRTIAAADPSGVISVEAQAIEDRVHRVEGKQMFSSLSDGRCMCGACGLDADPHGSRCRIRRALAAQDPAASSARPRAAGRIQKTT